ncbi:MAG TPA: hypothetical protein PKN70_07860 [Smithellaceae bacterium]|nr:hypothetical protein [Smithellaceae bacterium]HQM46945.1 hypothetical protein [Smithellaceae bacterium]
MKRLLVLMMLVLLEGCAVSIQATGFLDPSVDPSGLASNALIAVQTHDGAPNPVLEAEIGHKIEKLLLLRGYRTAKREQARYLLQFSYGMNPKLQHGTTTAYGPSQTHVIAVPDGKGGTKYIHVTTQGDMIMIPTVTEIFAKHLTLRVLDVGGVQEGQKEKTVWIVETAGADLSSDLRYDIDYLLAAAFACFGKDTGRQLTIRIGSDNSDLRALRSEDPKREGGSRKISGKPTTEAQ